MSQNKSAVLQAILATCEIPLWAQWLAIDEDGAVWIYAAEPHCFDHGWYENEVGKSLKIDQRLADPDWRLCLWKLDRKSAC